MDPPENAPDTGSAGRAVRTAVGERIRQRRRQRGMSGAELARRAGLGKATLSGLEAGRGNPTIDTLDAVAVALRVPLADLLTRDTDSGPVLVRGTAPPDEGPARELLRRISGGHSLELWRLRMPPGTDLPGIPHAPGTVEHLLVATGRVTAGPRAEAHRLGPGDLLSFAGDQPHGYRTDDEPADVTVLITSPVLH